MAVIVDFEGYTDNGKFIIKEFAIGELPQNAIQRCCFKHSLRCFHIKSNMPISKQNSLTNGIPYHYGSTPFTEIISFLNNQTLIYIKGTEKAEILQKYTTCKVLNLDETHDIPSFPNLFKKYRALNICDFHFFNKEYCALHKLDRIYQSFQYEK